MKKKKPDNVAWDEKEERYNQSILPYGTNISAPVIVLDDVAGFKSRGVNKVQKTFNSKFQEIKDDYEKLIDEVKICDPAIGSGAFPMGLLQEIFNALIYLFIW